MVSKLLGSADVDDDRLAAMVADLLGEPVSDLVDVAVDVVDYDVPAITTAGRWWVDGHARTANGIAPFRLFVKHVHSWSRSPLFAMVPPEKWEMAAASVPWRTEASVYRSDLATKLPDGLSMPRAAAVIDLDELSYAIWLEAIPEVIWPWDIGRFERAAHLLGRLAASPAVRPLAQIDDHQWSVHDYVHGRIENQVAPMLRDDATWSHPLVADSFDAELRRGMLCALDHIADWVDELAAGPHGTGHGDACPNNLLGAATADRFVLIDFGFWKPLPLGFDLGQLLVGDVQVGRRSTDDLAERDRRITAAYVAGLAVEGDDTDLDTIRRLHALQMTIFTGLSSIPFEYFGAPITDNLHRLVVDRATLTRYCLDLLHMTKPLS